MNNFSTEDKPSNLMATMFQHMFPSITVQSVSAVLVEVCDSVIVPRFSWFWSFTIEIYESINPFAPGQTIQHSAMCTLQP